MSVFVYCKCACVYDSNVTNIKDKTSNKLTHPIAKRQYIVQKEQQTTQHSKCF